MRYCRRTTIVEARQLTLQNTHELKEWTGGRDWSRPPMRAITGILLPHAAAAGLAIVEYGDWVVQLGDGKFTVWSDEQFKGMYEPVTEDS